MAKAPTYAAIQAHIRRLGGPAVKTCWIAHVKELNGWPVRAAWNRRSSTKREHPCPPAMRALIERAIRDLSQ